MLMHGDGDPLGAVASLLNQADYQTARAELRRLERARLTSEDQGRALAMDVLIAALCETERSARKHLWDAVEQHRDDVAYLHGTGLELAERGYLHWAEAVLNKACDIAPDNALGWYHLGWVLQRDERLEEAVEQFDKALRRDARLADAWLQRARCAADLGDLEAAGDSLRRYLALCPDDAGEWVSLAVVESDNGEFEAAYQAYACAEAVDASSVSLHFNWAITADCRGDLDRLRLALGKLENLAPDDWRTALITALLAEHEGEFDAAGAALATARARAAGPDDQDYRCEIAAVAVRFAARYGRWAELDAVVAWVFAEKLFGEEVLAALREIAGGESDQATEFQIVVDAQLPDRPESRYLRTFAVLADTEDQAVAMALAFERRCGAPDARVSRVEEMGEVEEREVGVWWRDEEISVYTP